MIIQLNKFLALCGAASRRKANFLIQQGRVQLNGEKVIRLGEKVDVSRDTVLLDDNVISIPTSYRYILLNKPAGVITSSVDFRGRKTVLDIIDVTERIFPVGRLDLDTEGVLILTNDGDLAYRLAHPRFEVDKIYEAEVRGRVLPDIIAKLKNGVEIDAGVIVSGEARIITSGEDKSLVEIKIHQGKKRQIKRMMKKTGHPVQYLNRKVFAGLTTDGLNKGEWRYLTQTEVSMLYSLVGLVKRAG